MKHKKLKIFLVGATAVVLSIVAIVFYFYQQGGKEHYVPPVAKHGTPVEQAVMDLETLSKAVEAYYSANLNYPQRIEELQSDFVSKVPIEPTTGKAYVYETDGSSKYRVSVPDPKALSLTELFIENGKLTKR